MQFKRLPTGIIVTSQRGRNGVVRIKIVNQDANFRYKYNVWWSKTKEILKSINIIT